MTARRVFFYVQHLLGIGHLARASRIARALAEAGFDVTLVTGGMPVAGFPGPGIRHVPLPPVAVASGAFAGLVDQTGTPVDDAFRDNRRDLLLAAFRAARPDIVMIEAFPFGRRQVRFELHPLLDAVAATRPRPRLVSSLRDILQRRGKLSRDEETVAVVRQYFDRILVHGDPSFAALADTFPFADAIADRVSYTGLVCGPKPVPSPERHDVVVSAGGGAVGAGVVAAALDAARLLPDLPRWCVITGPNLAQAAFDRFAGTAPANVTLVRFRTDFASLLAAARISVSQAGYNTVGDILQAGCRAVLLPYAAQGETEQADRAALLARHGRAAVIAEPDLSGQYLADTIRATLAQPASPNAPFIATDGTGRTVEILQDL